MKCKECRALVKVGECGCGKIIYVCNTEPIEFADPEDDFCNGLSFEK